MVIVAFTSTLSFNGDRHAIMTGISKSSSALNRESRSLKKGLLLVAVVGVSLSYVLQNDIVINNDQNVIIIYIFRHSTLILLSIGLDFDIKQYRLFPLPQQL